MGKLRDSSAWLAEAGPRFRRLVQARDEAGLERFAGWFADRVVDSALARIEACETEFWEYLRQTEDRWKARVMLWAVRHGADTRIGEFFVQLVARAFARLRRDISQAFGMNRYLTKELILSRYWEQVAARN